MPPPAKLLFPASVLLCRAGTRRNKFDCLRLYELRLQRVRKNCQLCEALNLNSLLFVDIAILPPFPLEICTGLVIFQSFGLLSQPSQSPSVVSCLLNFPEFPGLGNKPDNDRADPPSGGLSDNCAIGDPAATPLLC